MITKFNVNQIYSVRSICNYECIFSYVITKRTAKTVWIQSVNDDGIGYGAISSKRVEEYKGEETIYPKGNYSMAPVLGANDKDLVSPFIAVMEEYRGIIWKINEYRELCSDIRDQFSGKDSDIRIQSIGDEYGIEFLQARLKKLEQKMLAA